MRLFFALPMEAPTIQRVQAFQDSVPVEARLVRADLFHVTLVFIGNQPEGSISRLREVAGALDFPGTTVVLDRPGQFRRSQVGWLGATHVPEELERFRDQLAGRLAAAQIDFDLKPWKFHVTLYRKLRKPLPIMPPVAIEWTLKRFSLMESVSIRKGVNYREISHWPKSG